MLVWEKKSCREGSVIGAVDVSEFALIHVPEQYILRLFARLHKHRLRQKIRPQDLVVAQPNPVWHPGD